jgi:hypothetical protein
LRDIGVEYTGGQLCPVSGFVLGTVQKNRQYGEKKPLGCAGTGKSRYYQKDRSKITR